MATLNFVIENWYWGLFLLPNAIFWLVMVILGGFFSGYDYDLGYDYEPIYKYPYFFTEGVKAGTLPSNWTYGWRNTIRKIGVLINFITFFWVWGYIATLIFAALGFIVKWLWKGIKFILGRLGKMIKKGWKAL